MRNYLSHNGIYSFLLFFCVSFIAFFYQCVDAEYNLNQQIDRGFISRNAVFFTFEDSSEVDASRNTIEFNMKGEIVDGNSTTDLGSSPAAADDPKVTIDNSPDESGQTLVEQILSSGKGDYFASVHTGTGRYVYFQGAVQTPPVLEGRFFTSKECLSKSKLAVIGNKYLAQTFKEDNDLFLMVGNEKYRVIGTVGLGVSSTLDQLLFLNLGSVSYEEQMKGRFYIDGNSNEVNKVYSQMNTFTKQKIGIPLRRLTLPTTLTDIASGGVYMKKYLQVFVFLFLTLIYISILSKALSSDKKRIGSMLLVGISKERIIRQTFFPLFIFGLIGIAVTCILSGFLICFKFFSLPTSNVVREALLSCLISLFLLVFWLIPLVVHVNRFILHEVLRES